MFLLFNEITIVENYQTCDYILSPYLPLKNKRLIVGYKLSQRISDHIVLTLGDRLWEVGLYRTIERLAVNLLNFAVFIISYQLYITCGSSRRSTAHEQLW